MKISILMMEDHMSEFLEGSMKNFLVELSSKNAVPGGGGASAYAAALGMALGSMVANLTTGKKKYAEYQEEINQILAGVDSITDELASYIKKDAEAFEPLSKAYGMKADTDEEKKAKDEVMGKVLCDATKTPLGLMETTLESMKVLERLSFIGSKMAISDVGVGIQMAKAGLNGASLNVFINTKAMKDRNMADEFNFEADKMLAEGNKLADDIYERVCDQLR